MAYGRWKDGYDSDDLVLSLVAAFPAMEELLSQPQETIGDFDGPVALLGQDLMTQMPLRYSAARGTLWFRHD
eukprot:s1794_g10.t1